MKNKNRKFLLSLVLAIILIFARTSFADEIYSIDINADIDQNGIAHVTEVWKTNEDSFDATEKYKVISDLNGIKIRDFKVSRIWRRFYWNLSLEFGFILWWKEKSLWNDPKGKWGRTLLGNYRIWRKYLHLNLHHRPNSCWT